MKKSNLVLVAALAAAGVGIVGGSLLPTPAVAAAAAKKPAVSAAVLKPLKAAQESMTAKNWEMFRSRSARANSSRKMWSASRTRSTGTVTWRTLEA
jgi:hypothetical protein